MGLRKLHGLGELQENLACKWNLDTMTTTEGKHTPQQSDHDVDDVYSSSDFVKWNVDTVTTTEGPHTPQQSNNNVDDVYGSSDFVESNRYSELQNNLAEIYTNVQEFCRKEEFQRHVKTDRFDLENIDEKLRIWKEDVCPIVIAGETNSGKSSIINLILGEKILPTGIKACTSRVCRVKYCERYMVSTKDSENKELDTMSFQDSKEMAEQLKTLARTADKKISYVDIYMPVSLLQGNVIIVETPGCGDLGQKEVADRMLSYLPNALAFVFVVNVSNAGGFQDDRLLPFLSNIRDSMDGMVCFNPEDVIFLINKWDTISYVDEDIREEFFKNLKTYLRKLWKEVEDSCIFKIAAVKVLKKKPKYTVVFDNFQRLFKEKIASNESKRVKAHLRFLDDFLVECKTVLLTKLQCARQNAEDIHAESYDLLIKLARLEDRREKEILDMERTVDIFFDKVSEGLHAYIHDPFFKKQIFANTDSFTRFSINNELDIRIEKKTSDWLKGYFEPIFQRTLMNEIIKKFKSIHERLHTIEDNLKFSRAGGTIPPNPCFARAITGSTFSPFEARFILHIASSVLISKLAAANVIETFEKIRENAFLAKIAILTKENIRHSLKEKHSEAIPNMIKQFLEGDLQTEIKKIRENVLTMIDENTSEEKTLTKLLTTVTENIDRLKELDTSVIYHKTV